MKKIIFIFALAMLLTGTSNATDRDCVRYSASEAIAATSNNTTNTVGIVFSGMTARKGTTNADCAAASSSEQEVATEEPEPSLPAAPVEPATPATPEEEHNCQDGLSWCASQNKCTHPFACQDI